MSDTQAIKDRVDIVQLIQEYLPIKKAGANWKACCPFHHEKTPSFMIHPEKQIYHCFGCGKGGDVFSFIQEMEGMEFVDALKFLADRAGVKLETNFQSEAVKSQKSRLAEINEKAAYFFHRFLLEMPTAGAARDYLIKKRGLSEETVKDWQIGYIPEQWDLLTQYLLKKGFGIEDLVTAGLTIKNEERKSHYDRFRGRIMFPIWDALGNVVGFTGRLLVEKENAGGKYVNTPQSPLYDKSRVLYGLNKARQEIKIKDLAVIVEGQMDVIACHAAGMKNVIAASGTALTEEQVRLLKRYTSNIAMAFDADSAGQNAAKRGIDTALLAGLNIKVISVPPGSGKDADECLKKNPTIWFKAVEEAVGYMDWYFKIVLSGLDLNNPRVKQKAADSLLAEIYKIPFAVERDGWIQKLSEILGTDANILKESLKNFRSSTVKSSAEKEKILPAIDRRDLLQKQIWALVINQPKFYARIRGQVAEDIFKDTPFTALYDFAEKRYNINEPLDFNGLEIRGDRGENLVDLLHLQAAKDYSEWSDAQKEAEVEIVFAELQKIWKKEKIDCLKRELTAVRATGDEEKENSILKQIMELTK